MRQVGSDTVLHIQYRGISSGAQRIIETPILLALIIPILSIHCNLPKSQSYRSLSSWTFRESALAYISL